MASKFLVTMLALLTIPAGAQITRSAQVPSLRSGTMLPIRIEQAVSSKDAKPGDMLTGSLAVDLVENGNRRLPAGTPITLRVTDIQRAGHSGSAPRITLEAVFITIQGDDSDHRVAILTNAVTRTGNQMTQQPGQLLVNSTASLVTRLSGHYPGTYYGMGQSYRYEDARFTSGDIIRLSLGEETLLQ